MKVVTIGGAGHHSGHHNEGGVLSGTDPKKGGFQQIPSNSTDFPNNDPSAKKDIIGSYHVQGEITNVGNDTISSVLVTVHFYDVSGQLIAASTCCYTTPLNIDAGHTATFDSFVQAADISGKPVAYRLSFDWS